MVANWNKALRLSKELDLKPTDYHMISTDDTQYEKDYADTIMKYMDLDPSIAIASGNYDKIDYTMPHGAGRFIRNSFFFSFHGYYPEKMGYESVILYTAFQKRLKFRVIPEARFLHTREFRIWSSFLRIWRQYANLRIPSSFCIGQIC